MQAAALKGTDINGGKVSLKIFPLQSRLTANKIHSISGLEAFFCQVLTVQSAALYELFSVLLFFLFTPILSGKCEESVKLNVSLMYCWGESGITTLEDISLVKNPLGSCIFSYLWYVLSSESLLTRQFWKSNGFLRMEVMICLNEMSIMKLTIP